MVAPCASALSSFSQCLSVPKCPARARSRLLPKPPGRNSSARALAHRTVAALGPWTAYMRAKLGDWELHQDAATSVAHLNARLIRM
jgi:hypothetical protein